MKLRRRSDAANAIIALILLTTVAADSDAAATECRPSAVSKLWPVHKRTVLLYTKGDTLNCQVRQPRNCPSQQYEIRWFKNGQLLEFDANGVTAFSPLLGRLRQSSKLKISLVTRDMAGNYTCQVVNENYPNLCGPGQSRQLGCYAPETMATIRYVVDDGVQPATKRILSQFPPTDWTGGSTRRSGQPRLYLSRQSDARTAIVPLGVKPAKDDVFHCRLVVLPKMPEPATGSAVSVRWLQWRDGAYKPLTEYLKSNLSLERPAKQVPCQADDLGVYRLTDRQQASMMCYDSSLELMTTNKETVGYYRCDSRLLSTGPTVMMYHALDLPNSLLPDTPPGTVDIPVAPSASANFSTDATAIPAAKAAAPPPVPPARSRSLKNPQISFNRKTSVCRGASLLLDCRVNVDSSRADIRIERRFPNGTIVPLADLNPDSRAADVIIGNRSSMTRGMNDQIWLTYRLTNLTLDDSGLYACKAKVLRDDYAREFVDEEMHVTVLDNCASGSRDAGAPVFGTGMYIGLGVGSGLLVSLVTCILVCIYYFQKRRTDPIVKRLRIVCVDNGEVYRQNWRRDNGSDSPLLARSSYYRQESLDRPGNLQVPEVIVEEIGRGGRWLGFGARRGGGGGNGASEANKEVRYIIPSCPVLEMERRRIQMFRLLGEGAFGTVHSGQIAYTNCKTQDVAVKMLKRDYTEEEMVSLVKEMEIMKMMKPNPHPNVIKLIGVCTKDGPFMLLVELAQHGNLRDFLKERLVSSDPAEYLNLLPGTRRVCFLPCIRPVQLLRFSIDVASALEFMASIKIVHRDIAARNILVANAENADAIVAKVADFGLTRNVSDKDYYRVITEGKLPVKWLAPECLKSRIFSAQSDVWAFGILLYEIFSQGEIPYPGVSPSCIMPHLEAGYLNPQPRFAGPELYSLMRDCWIWEPRMRPTFASILTRLRSLEPYYAATDRP